MRNKACCGRSSDAEAKAERILACVGWGVVETPK